jgi:hypothetical protein
MRDGYIRGVNAKLGRAEEHRETIKRMVRDYFDHNIDGWRAHVDDEGRWHYVGRLGQIPLTWAPIVGDYIHNLRSALEHLAGALIEGNGGTPTKKSTFPVMAKPPVTKRLGISPHPNIKPGGIHPDARPLLDATQPYTFGDGYEQHPLWLLEEFWNFDKHELILFTTPMMSGYTAHDERARLIGVTGDLVVSERTEHTTTFVFKPDPEHDVDVHAEITLRISFGPDTPADGQSMTMLLDELDGFVRNMCVGPLRPFAASA